MYQYDQIDQSLVDQRVAQYRDQTQRYLAGQLSEDDFRSLRLRNGLYIQKHAPMLRISIPYGLLRPAQVRMLARVAREYDKGYGHFSTRQNMQFNWPKLELVPDILALLATVQLHGIQTSGNCIRNVTADHLAGVAVDELEDPRPWCEYIRQWATLHPEFSYLPRKFKIAVTGSPADRAASRVHDVGLHLRKNEQGEVGFEVLVGGGLGRAPMIGHVIREFLPKKDLLAYLEAILRVYNLEGRRDNIHKARIKILVKAIGPAKMRELVEEEFAAAKDTAPVFDAAEFERIKAFFAPKVYESLQDQDVISGKPQEFRNWFQYNTRKHKVAGYRAVFLSLKSPTRPPGDITADELDRVADLAEQYSLGEIRSTHDQNVLFAHVKQSDLFALWQQLKLIDLATANIGTLTDMICCPGGDFCALANARSIPLATQINERFDSLDYLYDLGEIQLKMSGCMNGCGHHSVGHIGVLGVDKDGEEWYQITLGGSTGGHDASLGKVIGPSVAHDDVAETIERIIHVFVEHRQEEERFLDTFRRIGVAPFKAKVYAPADQAA
ncbi:sulfite reductase [Steroidobacter agaridevorans]|uniref:Sulfite reductase n=1 Tax=Steroidobacter agaridevorans TaxID=2695856 RepID=A0A829Y807_9GAMM|nr:nitrite/sulfite reductase [Steroidobacter agaridevorans]GFE79320.1 sulfite reductase [Steroidobacter agaridevorans]GFE88325.1 sulfite reductase [Steroidobacter agaridevorans]